MTYDLIPVDQPVPHFVPSYILPLQYSYTVLRYCEAYGVPVWLVCRLINYESHWNPSFASAKRKDGNRDEGLGAHNSKFKEELGKLYCDWGGGYYDPMLPDQAIQVTVRLLAHLETQIRITSQFRRWKDAVAAYNLGLTGWRKTPRSKWPRETRALVEYVMGEGVR